MLLQTTSTYTSNRIYLDEKGCKYPSISTLANFFGSTLGLYFWTVKLGKQIAAEQELEGLTKRELYDLGKPEAKRIKEATATLGTCVHRAIETNSWTDNDDYDRYVNQYRLKIAPYLEILHQEIVLSYTTLDRTMRMAGTADIVAKWKGELALCDLKTSEEPKKVAYMGRFSLQLAAYALSFEQEYGEFIDTGYIFNLNPDNALVFRIPLQPAKDMLLSTVLPNFYEFYKQPEPRGYPNQFRGMGAILDTYEKDLAKQIIVE